MDIKERTSMIIFGQLIVPETDLLEDMYYRTDTAYPVMNREAR